MTCLELFISINSPVQNGVKGLSSPAPLESTAYRKEGKNTKTALAKLMNFSIYASATQKSGGCRFQRTLARWQQPAAEQDAESSLKAVF
jgi:hypothetical protein